MCINGRQEGERGVPATDYAEVGAGLEGIPRKRLFSHTTQHTRRASHVDMKRVGEVEPTGFRVLSLWGCLWVGPPSAHRVVKDPFSVIVRGSTKKSAWRGGKQDFVAF